MRRNTEITSHNAEGFTLAEVLITVGLVAILLAVYSAVLASTVFLRRSQYNIQAADFIQEEIDTLRSLPTAELLNRASGAFLGIPFQRGAWTVQTVGDDSQNRRLVLPAAKTAVGDETGLVVLPGNYRTDFTFTAKFKADNASPGGWDAALTFRYRDAENFYRLRVNQSGWALDRRKQGALTLVDSGTTAFANNTWYQLRVVASGNSFSLYWGTQNQSPLTLLKTVTDTTPLLSGDLALMAVDGALLSFDDVSVTENAVTTIWNFEADADNVLPVAWQRLSCLDMPSGACTLTIEDYLSETSMKKITVVVTWNDGGNAKSATGMTVIKK